MSFAELRQHKNAPTMPPAEKIFYNNTCSVQEPVDPNENTGPRENNPFCKMRKRTGDCSNKEARNKHGKAMCKFDYERIGSYCTDDACHADNARHYAECIETVSRKPHYTVRRK